MEAAGAYADNLVPHCNLRTVQQFFIIDYSYHKACQVIFILGIKAWHFSSLTPDEGAFGFHTSGSNPLNNITSPFRIKLPHGYVVKEKKRGSTLDHDVVHAHGHKVYSHGIVFIEHKCNLQLCANSVGGTHKHRVFDMFNIERKESGKTSNVGNNA